MRNEKKESGQALVEFALVLIPLLILIFGAIEFGRIFHATHVITSAAREGARAAAVHGSDDEIKIKIEDAVGSLVPKIDDDGIDNIINSTGTPGVGKVYFDVEPDSRPDDSGGNVRVEVKTAVSINIPVISIITGNPKIISSYSDMRLE